MWLLVTLYFCLNFKSILPFGSSGLKNEPLELSNLFLENLKVDPLLLDDLELSEKSKRFIDNKLENFVILISESQNAVFSRNKRSLDKNENTTKYSISISPENVVPTENSDDIRIFEHGSEWFAIALQNKDLVSVLKLLNGTFTQIYSTSLKYSTNLAVLSLEEFPIIIVGEDNKILVFQLDFASQQPLQKIQTIVLNNPHHVVVWEQDYTAYLAITDSLVNPSNENEDKASTIKIYTWLGRHFDLKQEIDLLNIKKCVAFNIHGSFFLAAVKSKTHEDEMKSYSEIFKFDLHSSSFTPYQRLLTNGVTDIKYFTSQLYGERQHFLVVVHSLKTEVNENNTLKIGTKSVIYKYADQYFTPFQNVDTDAVEWQPIQDAEGHAALLAVTKDGLQGFQYDGWHFFESKILIEQHADLRLNDKTVLHSFDFKGNQMLVFTCDRCVHTTNVFAVDFTDFNSKKELHFEVLSWCLKSLNDLETGDHSDFVAESLRGDLDEEISLEEDQKRQLSAALTGSNGVLINLEELVENSLQASSYTFKNNLEAENVIFNDKVHFKSLYTNSLNHVHVDSLYENVVDISKGFDMAPEFDHVVSENTLLPTVINTIQLDSFIFINNDVSVQNMIVNGTVNFKKSVKIEKTFNNLTVNDQNLLLNKGDQKFLKNITINDIAVNNLTITYLNDLHLFSVKHCSDHYNLSENETLQNKANILKINSATANICTTSNPISHIDSLRVKDLKIGGLLNDVSIPVLEKRTLKTTGDHILEKTLIVDSLSVFSLNVDNKVSGKKIPDDFVMIDQGEYVVGQDVKFLKGLKANKLEVLHSLNNITVRNDGELDILLTDSPLMQSIPVKKSFETLIVSNPINIRDKIQNDQMDRINPVTIDSDFHSLDSDVTIEGRVEVRRLLLMGNLNGKGDERSFKDVLEKGVKVTDNEIGTQLIIEKPLSLKVINAEKVNNLNPQDWMLQDFDSKQIVNSHKTFLSDLYLEELFNIQELNDINVNILQNEVLLIKGDQKINGLFKIDKVDAEKGIISNLTLFDEYLWSKNSNINRNDGSEFSIINGNLRVNLTKARDLDVKGLINSLNFSETLRDIVRKDAKYKVFGEKEVIDLRVDDLVIKGDEVDVLRLLKDINNNEVTLKQNIQLVNDINIKNINFDQRLNNITKADFTNMIHFHSANVNTNTVNFDREYDQITVLGQVFIKDNLINGKTLTSIVNDTVKVDEDHEFKDVSFDETICVQDSVQLEGNMENLDLNNIFEQNSEQIAELNEKTFNEDVVVNGMFNIQANLNGYDLENICRFSQENNLKRLKIKGDVVFVKGPNIFDINGLNVQDLLDRVWFVDRPVEISGTVNLRNTTFSSSVNVTEFVDETNLSLLSQNYLSKSRDQTVSAIISFEDVAFVNISTPFLTTKGTINGIQMNELTKTMLLQNVTQVFESSVYLEEVLVEDLSDGTNYSVNELNLNTDVLLYDGPNTVTGHKIVDNIEVETLYLKDRVHIQDVDVLDWLDNAILTNGSFSVSGKKILRSASFGKGLSLRGKLNDQEFNEDTIMLQDTFQNIIGKKIFVTNNDNIVKFKTLRVKGLVNDLYLESFVKNQSDKNKHSTLNSEIIFNNSVVVKNINVDMIYDDINVTELLANITELGALESYKDKYNNLLDMSLNIENLLKDKAFFFKHFKEIMELENVYDVLGVKCKDGIFRLISWSFKNETNTLKTFEWEINLQEFVFTGEIVESNALPTFMEQISLGGSDYIYIEHPVSQNESDLYSQSHFGQLLQLVNSTTLEPVAQFKRNATKSLISFELPGIDQSCLGFMDAAMSGIEILCDETGMHDFSLQQMISVGNVYKATTVRTTDSLYLFLAKQGITFREYPIVVMESNVKEPELKIIQTVYEDGNFNGMTAAVIGNVPYVVFSFGSQEATVNSGRVTIRKLHQSTNKFVHWQHIPLAAPIEVHFVTEASFEPLLLVPSADASSPLHTLSYDGSAGFRKSLKGAALPPKSKIKIIQGGRFLVSLQEDRGTGLILGAVFKGAL